MQLQAVVVRWFLSLLTIVLNHFTHTLVDLLEVLNCSSAYGEKGAVAEGTLASENTVNAAVRGKLLINIVQQNFLGTATESDVDNCITTQGQGTATVAGAGGASARIF